MKKYIKYFLAPLFAFVIFISSISATTIKETTIDGDNYDTIEEGSIVIGVTKFHSDVVLTGARATKAGSNDVIVYTKLHSSLDGYEAPVIYVYAGGAWYALDDNNDAEEVTDSELINSLSNIDIYFVDNVEKKIDINVENIDVDEASLPKGVTYKGGKIYVNATTKSFDITTTNGKTISYIKEGNEFIQNNAVCYTVSNGKITDYSNACVSDVQIPSVINEEDVTSIASGAFQNKGITSVVIPGSVKNIEDNAFSDEALQSVIIEDKYDEGDFQSIGSRAFGSFTNVKYKNDLTELLDSFSDNIELNVSEDFDIDNNKYLLANFADYQEFNRLGLSRDDNYLINGKYNINIGFDWDQENQTFIYDNLRLEIMISYNDPLYGKSVSKDINYEVNKVKKENNDYKNIIQEYEDYYVNLKDDFINSGYKTKITGKDKFYDICDDYNYDCVIAGDGDGMGESSDDIILNEGSAEALLIYNDVLYDFYDVTYYSVVNYNIELTDAYENDDELVEAGILKFEEDIDITNYEITYDGTKKYSGPYVVDGFKIYMVILTDNDTKNNWFINIKKKAVKGEIITSVTSNGFVSQDGSKKDYVSNYYYPTKTLEEFGGTIEEYKEYAINELKEKVNLDGYNFPYVSIMYNNDQEADENGFYTNKYVISFQKEEENEFIVYQIYFSKKSKTLASQSNSSEVLPYEVSINPDEYAGKYEEYKEAATTIFKDAKNVSDYVVNDWGLAQKDPDTGDFSMIESISSEDQENKYFVRRLLDYDTGNVWYLYIPYSYVVF